MNTNRYQSFLYRSLIIPALSLVVLAARGSDSEAISFFDYLADAAAIPIASQLLAAEEAARAAAQGRTPNFGPIFDAEAKELRNSAAMYRQEQANNNNNVMGQAALAGAFPVSELVPGTDALLTFDFIDPATGAVTAGPAVGSVLYEVNTGPTTPDIFVPIGVSFDAVSHFALPFTVRGFEPLIRATPFDPSGRPIVIRGVDGNNIAVGVVVNIGAVVEAARVTRFNGSANRAGETGANSAQVRISGRFTSTAPIDLGGSTVTMVRLLAELGGAGELVEGAPIQLRPRAGGTRAAAVFETPSGAIPRFRLQIELRDPRRGVFDFTLAVDRTSIPAFPQLCTGDPLTTDLTAGFIVDGGIRPLIVVAAERPWRCLDLIGGSPEKPHSLRSP